MTDFAKLVLEADTRGLKKGEKALDDLGRKGSKTAGEVDRQNAGMARSFLKLGGAIVGALGVSGAIGSVIRTNAEFGNSMSKVAAISGATGEELDKLRQTAKDMGATTMFSASQAADALGFLAMAGFNASEAMEALPDVLSLAAAGGMELAQAADIASNVLSGFGLAADEASRAADVLAVAASSTNTSVSQLGQAMSTAAPIAAALGVSMEETAAAIGVMSDAGIQGERAGTALRGVFASLAGPTKQARDALAKYGLAAKDIDPQVVGLAAAMGKLAKAAIEPSDAMIIFGREAASGALVMADASDRMEELTESFRNAEGAAADMAETMQDNLNGDILALKSALEGLIITLGDSGATGGFRTLAQTATGALRAITENMAALTTALGTLVIGFVAYRGAVTVAALAQTAYNSTLFNAVGVAVLETRATAGATVAKIAYTGAATGAKTITEGLNAALARNPFTAVAVALATLTAGMWAFRNSQAAAKAETDALIGSLKGLAQARSADFAIKRYEAQKELNDLRDERTGLETLRDRLEKRGSGAFLRNVNAKLTEVGLDIVGIESQISLADRAFEEAGKTMESIVIPAANAANTISGIGDAVASATAKATPFRDLMENLFPEDTTRRQMDDLQLLAANAEAVGDRMAEARRRILGTDRDGEISQSLLTEGPLKVADKVLEAAERMGDGMAESARKAKRDTVDIAESFASMAQSAIQSVQGLISSIKGGGFLDILGSVFGLMGALGIGGSGGKAQGLLGAIGGIFGFDGGGYTGNGARAGGLDGKGGFLAMMHPQETVVDHSKGQRMGGGMTVNVDARGATDPTAVRQQINLAIAEAAPAIVAASEARTVRSLSRPRLAGLGR